MPYNFVTMDVFTQIRFTGNQLAVFPDARGLDTGTMGRIANEFNLSETTFVLPPEIGGSYRVRIFTPNGELPFAGHPTVGTALVLKNMGWSQSRIVLEEGVGAVPVDMTPDGRATLTVPAPPRQMILNPSYGELAAVLGLETDAVLSASVWTAGLPYTIIEVRNPDDLASVVFTPEAFRESLMHTEAPDIYVFCRLEKGLVRARMFAPLAGIPEDPATGSAAAALAGHLSLGTYRIEQGVEMGRPSLIHLHVGEVVRVGGHAVPVFQGTLDL